MVGIWFTSHVTHADVCSSVLQCVAVCCSVLQCVSMEFKIWLESGLHPTRCMQTCDVTRSYLGRDSSMRVP